MSNLVERLQDKNARELRATITAIEAERDALREALLAIEDLCSGEIKARFTSSSQTEEEVAGNSRVYALLRIPRDIARNALGPKPC